MYQHVENLYVFDLYDLCASEEFLISGLKQSIYSIE